MARTRLVSTTDGGPVAINVEAKGVTPLFSTRTLAAPLVGDGGRSKASPTVRPNGNGPLVIAMGEIMALGSRAPTNACPAAGGRLETVAIPVSLGRSVG